MWLAIRKEKGRKLRLWGFRLAGAFFPTTIFFALAIVAGGPGVTKLPPPIPRLAPPNFGVLIPFAHDNAPAAAEGRAAAATPDSAALLQPVGPGIVPVTPTGDGLNGLARLADLGSREVEAGYKAAAAS